MNLSTLKRISEYEWEVPQKEGANVPARIFGTEKLVREMDEQVRIQLENVTFLPGIQRYAIALCDAHWGYGFCIGGIGAFDPKKGGVVTMGGIGFDISCLPGETSILGEHGYKKPIRSFKNSFPQEKIKCVNPSSEVKDTSIKAFIQLKPKNRVLKIKTRGGWEITATADHPFLTPEGMKPLGEITNEPISIFPFEGADFAEPDDKIVVREKDILNLPWEKDMRQTIQELKQRNLLPLKRNNPKFPYLLKLAGYILGDGTMYFVRNKGFIWFYGDPEDLQEIQKDIEKLGFKASRIYQRTRSHRIDTLYGRQEFTRTETSIKTTASSLVALFWAMGFPLSDKTKQDWVLPQWFLDCPLWQKRLFLASFFGAELASPKIHTGYTRNFSSLILSLNKKQEFLESGRIFLAQIRNLLEEFGVESTYVKERREYVNKEGKVSIRLRLNILPHTENLLRFFSKVGYEYNKKRRFLACAAIQYLRLKQKVVEERKKAISEIKELQRQGVGTSKIYQQLTSPNVNPRFIQRTLYEGRRTPPRIAYRFPSFGSFLKDATRGLGQTGQVWDRIEECVEIPFDDLVYDFTVEDKHHNFIANNFVVSNCGVRTMKTGLTINEVRPRLPQLVETLFRDVPAGLGVPGKLKVNVNTLDQILVEGAHWAVKNGFGEREDLAAIEDGGKVEGANPDNVSQIAKKRQLNKMGTLGSGNHYVEVQVVDQVYDEKVAQDWGLKKDDVVVTFHCGSRALGHQVGTDYLKSLAATVQKYKIKIPDRELVCAPIESPEGQKYLSAVFAGINCALGNRQILAHLIRQSVKKVFPGSVVSTLYDVSHNTAKFEKGLLVHRKGATRAFKDQPVIIGGSMGTASFLLIGTGDERTFSSCIHGAGRTMSRKAAKRRWWGANVVKDLAKKGIIVKTHSMPGVAEEAPGAYKDIEEIVDAVDKIGLSKKVVRLKPLGCVKG